MATRGRCKVGNQIFVSGTTGTDADGNVAEAMPARRPCRLSRTSKRRLIRPALRSGDVVRTRLFVTDISNWEASAEPTARVFGDILPATAMVEVSALIDPKMLVEIEADAVVANYKDFACTCDNQLNDGHTARIDARRP